MKEQNELTYQDLLDKVNSLEIDNNTLSKQLDEYRHKLDKADKLHKSQIRTLWATITDFYMRLLAMMHNIPSHPVLNDTATINEMFESAERICDDVCNLGATAQTNRDTIFKELYDTTFALKDSYYMRDHQQLIDENRYRGYRFKIY